MKSARPLAILAMLLPTTLGLLSNPVSANGLATYTDFARVTYVEPIYHHVTVSHPQRICRQVPSGNYHDPGNRRYNSHRHSDNRSNNSGSVFVGALIGGAIGNELSRSVNGRSSTGATLAGAAIGSALANAGTQSVNNNRHNRYHNNNLQPHNRHRLHGTDQHYSHHRKHRKNRHCTVTNHTRKERQLQGYNVTYRYHGRDFQTRTVNHPGDRIAIKVSLSSNN